MKATLKVEKEFNITKLKVKAGVRYWEDSEVNNTEDSEGKLIPFRNGDYWCPIIDLDNGIIIDWPKGTTANIHYKVCDDGTYILIDENNETLIEYSGYVRDIMCPEDEGYGDYIIMRIDENGKIKDFKPIINDFFEDEE